MSDPHSRSSDPLTSSAAAGQVDIDGKRLEVWTALSRMDNGRSSTWDEMKVALPHVKPDSISNRFPELVELYYAYRFEVDKFGNIVGIVIGMDVHRPKIRYKTRACLFSKGRQLINYWHAPWLPLPNIPGVATPAAPPASSPRPRLFDYPPRNGR